MTLEYVDLVLMQNSPACLLVNHVVIVLNSLHLHMTNMKFISNKVNSSLAFTQRPGH